MVIGLAELVVAEETLPNTHDEDLFEVWAKLRNQVRTFGGIPVYERVLAEGVNLTYYCLGFRRSGAQW